jgi:hypothetical protein
MYLGLKKIIDQNHEQEPPLAQNLASTWIRARLRALDERRDRLEIGMQDGLSELDPSPHGYALRSESYIWERALLERLLQEVQNKPFPDVLRSSIRQSRLEDNIPLHSGSEARRNAYFRRKLEAGVLRELARDWSAMVKSVTMSDGAH